MRKSRKLLSLFLLLVFIVPFVPNNVYEVSAIDAHVTSVELPNGSAYGDWDDFVMLVGISGVDPSEVTGATAWFNVSGIDREIGIGLWYEADLGKYSLRGKADRLFMPGKYTLSNIELTDVAGVKYSIGLNGNGAQFNSNITKKFNYGMFEIYDVSVETLTGVDYSIGDEVEVIVTIPENLDGFDYGKHHMRVNYESEDVEESFIIRAYYDEVSGKYKGKETILGLGSARYKLKRVGIANIQPDGEYVEASKYGFDEVINLNVPIPKAVVDKKEVVFREGNVKTAIDLGTTYKNIDYVIMNYHVVNDPKHILLDQHTYDPDGVVSISKLDHVFEPEGTGKYILNSVELHHADGQTVLRFGNNVDFTGEPYYDDAGNVSIFDGVKLDNAGSKFEVVDKEGVVHPKVSSLVPTYVAGAENGVGAWWAGLELELDNGSYDEVTHIVAHYENHAEGVEGWNRLDFELRKDKNGKFVGDTLLHRFLKPGTFELRGLGLYNSKDKAVYVIESSEIHGNIGDRFQAIAGGNFELGKEQFLGIEQFNLKASASKLDYGFGEPVKINFNINIPEGVAVVPYKYAFAEVYKDGDDMAKFARLVWNNTKRAYEPVDLELPESGSYTAEVVWFSERQNTEISGNRLDSAFSVVLQEPIKFNINSILGTSLEDLYEGGEKYYAEIEKTIASLNPNSPEHLAKIRQLERLLQDIDKKGKAVEPEVAPEAPKFVFEGDNLRALNIAEARDPNVKSISVEIDFEIKTPEEIEELLGTGTAVIGLYDMSLIKRVIKKDNSETVGTIANEDILDKITLRLPISKEMSKKALKVVYVADDGTITELETRLVVVGEEGAETYYLQFETDHFSMYGILDVTELGAPVDPEEPVVEPEEPIVKPEEPVEEPKDPEVKPETPKEEEKIEDKEEETLPKAGSGGVWMYTLSGLALAGAGTFGLKKERK